MTSCLHLIISCTRINRHQTCNSLHKLILSSHKTVEYFREGNDIKCSYDRTELQIISPKRHIIYIYLVDMANLNFYYTT